jgi:hypothetical protein
MPGGSPTAWAGGWSLEDSPGTPGDTEGSVPKPTHQKRGSAILDDLDNGDSDMERLLFGEGLVTTKAGGAASDKSPVRGRAGGEGSPAGASTAHCSKALVGREGSQPGDTQLDQRLFPDGSRGSLDGSEVSVGASATEARTPRPGTLATEEMTQGPEAPAGATSCPGTASLASPEAVAPARTSFSLSKLFGTTRNRQSQPSGTAAVQASVPQSHGGDAGHLTALASPSSVSTAQAADLQAHRRGARADQLHAVGTAAGENSGSASKFPTLEERQGDGSAVRDGCLASEAVDIPGGRSRNRPCVSTDRLARNRCDAAVPQGTNSGLGLPGLGSDSELEELLFGPQESGRSKSCPGGAQGAAWGSAGTQGTESDLEEDLFGPTSPGTSSWPKLYLDQHVRRRHELEGAGRQPSDDVRLATASTGALQDDEGKRRTGSAGGVPEELPRVPSTGREDPLSAVAPVQGEKGDDATGPEHQLQIIESSPQQAQRTDLQASGRDEASSRPTR